MVYEEKTMKYCFICWESGGNHMGNVLQELR